jgi:anti-sigma B factor antagonist
LIEAVVTFDQGQPFEIRAERPADGALTVRLYGEFDLACCEQFSAALARLDGNNLRRLEIDLTQLTFIDSSAIRALLAAKTRAAGDHLELHVTLPTDGQVLSVLKLTGLDDVLAGARHSPPGPD